MAAQLAGALGCQADVSTHNDSSVEDGFDAADDAPAPFQLDCIHIGFLKKTPGVNHGVFIGFLVAHKRHVAHNKGVRSAPTNSLAMDDALIHRHRHGAFVPIHAHAHGVTDEDHFHPCFLLKLGGRIIVRS
ncbi:hypothetical protein ES703_74151 [subsurface metagenome]